MAFPFAAKIAAQPGPQTAFLRSGADICIYGGAAGGGKTAALILEPLRHVGRVANFTAVFFRRTMPQITNPGALWDHPGLGGTPNRLCAPDPASNRLCRPDAHAAGTADRVSPGAGTAGRPLAAAVATEPDIPRPRASEPILSLRPGSLAGRSAENASVSQRPAHPALSARSAVLTSRPLCAAIVGSISSARIALSRARVPPSSAPIRREYPATSAAKIAARRRVWFMSPRPSRGAGPKAAAHDVRGFGAAYGSALRLG